MEKSNTPTGSILIAHLADSHLRDTQYATTRRGLDFYEALERAVQLSIKKADILVMSGDIFDRARPSPAVIGQLMSIDRMLIKAEMRMLSITGNHDWCDPTWLLTLFGERKEEDFGIIPMDDRKFTFNGFEFVGVRQRSAAEFRNSLAAITIATKSADVVLYHGLIEGIVPIYAGPSNPLNVEELPVSVKNRAWLLGDIHIQGYVTRPNPSEGTCLIGYPGSLEVCSTSESLDKSVPIIHLTKAGAQVREFVPVPTRKFICATIRDESELDTFLNEQVRPYADRFPVVHVDFDRRIPTVVNRLHSILDAQRCVVRCYPLPEDRSSNKRDAEETTDEESLGMEHFVSARFNQPGEEELHSVALDLLHRGEQDANNILSGFIERRKLSTSPRE